MLTPEQDAYGEMLMAYHKGDRCVEIVERDDGYIDTSAAGPAIYFAPFDQWHTLDQQAMERVRGRVLDVGCGAGRHSLYLQEQGHEVVGIDLSPGAVDVCRQRGVRDVRILPVTQVSRELGLFDTIIMMGNNWGLVGNQRRAPWLLRRFKSITTPEGRIVALTNNPYGTTRPEHLAYHKMNREAGRLSGRLRIRVRYGTAKSPWFEYLLVSQEELAEIVKGTGWRIAEIIEVPPASPYVLLLERE